MIYSNNDEQKERNCLYLTLRFFLLRDNTVRSTIQFLRVSCMYIEDDRMNHNVYTSENQVCYETLIVKLVLLLFYLTNKKKFIHKKLFLMIYDKSFFLIHHKILLLTGISNICLSSI